MNSKANDVVPADGLSRAAWVDADTNPKKHGEFEGYLKGEPHKVFRYFWTGRRWLFKTRLGKWVPSVFGEKGDKWRGLCDTPDILIEKVDGLPQFPENPVLGAKYSTAAGEVWSCTGKRWFCLAGGEDDAVQSIAKSDEVVEGVAAEATPG